MSGTGRKKKVLAETALATSRSSANSDPLSKVMVCTAPRRGFNKRASGSIEVGHIRFSEQLKRTPIATEAMFLMMKRAFELGYRRYEWKCDALNAPSCAAAKRFGFRYEGTFRQATVYKGRNRDTAWFSVIDTEWPVLFRAFSQWLAPDNFDEFGEQRARLSELTQEALRQ